MTSRVWGTNRWGSGYLNRETWERGPVKLKHRSLWGGAGSWEVGQVGRRCCLDGAGGSGTQRRDFLELGPLRKGAT